MTIFEETINEIEESTDKFFDLLDKCDFVKESCYRTYLENAEKIELKVMTEYGSKGDKDDLDKENKKSFGQKLKSILQKIWDGVCNVCHTIASKIKSLFGRPDVQEALKKCKAECEKNPKLKKELITIIDVKDMTKEIDKDIHIGKKVLARINGNKYTEVDGADLAKIRAAAKAGRRTRFITVTIIAAIAICEAAAAIAANDSKIPTEPITPVEKWDGHVDNETIQEQIDANNIIAGLYVERQKLNASAATKILNSIKKALRFVAKGEKEMELSEDASIIRNYDGSIVTDEFAEAVRLNMKESNMLLNYHMENVNDIEYDVDDIMDLYSENAIDSNETINMLHDMIFE